MTYTPTAEEDRIAAAVVDAGFQVHKSLGPGLLELVIVEVKAVENILQIHQAQLMTYLKLSGCRVGLLMNFTVPMIKSGIRRIVL